MSSSINHQAFDRATDPIFRILSREQVAQFATFHTDEALQQRIEQLARRANEGELTAEEKAEYEGYAYANKFLAVLQSKAQRALHRDRQP